MIKTITFTISEKNKDLGLLKQERLRGDFWFWKLFWESWELFSARHEHSMESFREDFQNYIESLQELLDSLVFIRFKWMEYSDNLESRVNSSYQVSVLRGNGRERPRFDVSKDILSRFLFLT